MLGDTMVAFLYGSECTVALGDTMVAFVLGFGDAAVLGDTVVAFQPGSGCTVALGDTMVAFLLGFGDIIAVSPLDLGTLWHLGTPWWPSSLGLGTSQLFPPWTWGCYSAWGHHGGLPLWV